MAQQARQPSSAPNSVGGQYASKPTPDVSDSAPILLDETPSFGDVFPFWFFAGLTDHRFVEPVDLECGRNLNEHIRVLVNHWEKNTKCWCGEAKFAAYCPVCLNVEIHKPATINGYLDRAHCYSYERQAAIVESAFKATFNAHGIDERLANLPIIEEWRRSLAPDAHKLKANVFWMPSFDPAGAPPKLMDQTDFVVVNGIWLLPNENVRQTLRADFAGTLTPVDCRRNGDMYGVWNPDDDACVRIPAEHALNSCVAVTTRDLRDSHAVATGIGPQEPITVADGEHGVVWIKWQVGHSTQRYDGVLYDRDRRSPGS